MSRMGGWREEPYPNHTRSNRTSEQQVDTENRYGVVTESCQGVQHGESSPRVATEGRYREPSRRVIRESHHGELTRRADTESNHGDVETRICEILLSM